MMLTEDVISPQESDQYHYYKDIKLGQIKRTTQSTLITNRIENSIPNKDIKDTIVIQKDTLLIKYYIGLGIALCRATEDLYVHSPKLCKLHTSTEIRPTAGNRKGNVARVHTTDFYGIRGEPGDNSPQGTQLFVPVALTTPLSNLI